MNDRRNPPPERRNQSDRRDYLRVPTAVQVRFLRAAAMSDTVLDADLVDVSHSGVRIQSHQPLVRGEVIAIEVRDGAEHCFNLSAHVVWVEADPDDQHCVGCELRVELTRKQFALLQKLVAVAHP